MTCIVGLEHEGSIYVGADSAAVRVETLDSIVITDPKVFVLEDTMVIGFTDTFRLGQILQHGFQIPEKSQRKSDIAYLVTDFVDELRETFRRSGYMRKDPDLDVETGGSFLLGFNGRLYEISQMFDVIRSAAGYAAVGCGAPYALGAMSATSGQAPELRIKTALEAATNHSAGVHPPFCVMRLPAQDSVTGAPQLDEARP